MIYLASPYTHADVEVMEERYRRVCRAAAELFKRGHFVFSPIAHSHGVAAHGAGVSWNVWEAFDIEMLRRCEELYVLTLAGWETSVGVAAEMEWARENGYAITLLGEDGATEEVDFDEKGSQP